MVNFEVTPELWEQLHENQRRYSPQKLRERGANNFLENTQRKREEISEQLGLIERIRTAIKEGPWEGYNCNFCRLGNGLALKARTPEDHRIALTVKASLYHPSIPITSFAIIVNQCLKCDLERDLYLVGDLGKIVDLTVSPRFTREITEQVSFLNQYLASRGYYQKEDRGSLKPYGINRNLAVMDLDCREMVNIIDIFRGTFSGKGSLGDLKDNFFRLKEYELKI